MEETCAFCVLTLEGDAPRCELQCHHSFHTMCVLQHFSNDFTECPTCHVEMLGNDNDNQSVDTSDIADERNFIQMNALYDTNETFRKDVKKYIESQRAVSKAYIPFTRIVNAKKNELRPQYAQIKAQIRQLFRTKKNEVTSTPEYKACKSAQAKNTRLYRHLRNEYDLRRGGITALREKPGCRTIRRPLSWRGSPAWRINRCLRLRLPYHY